MRERTREREEEEKEEEEMDRQTRRVKSRVVKIESEESWDFFITQANNQACPVRNPPFSSIMPAEEKTIFYI